MLHYWLQLAIHLCGGRKKLARLIGTEVANVTYWLNYGESINLLYATRIEYATKGRVSRIHLVSELTEKDIAEIKAECEAAKKMRAPLTFREKVELGLAHEVVLGGRKGMRNDLLLRENFPNVNENSSKSSLPKEIFYGRTEEIVFKFAGFGNYKTYQQAKKILKKGIPELIDLAEKDLPVSRAAQIAQFLPEKQRYFLSLERHAMIQALHEAALHKKLQIILGNHLDSSKINDELNRSHCLPTATWALLSFVGIFQQKTKNRRLNYEQDQDCETRVIPPRTTL